MDDLFGDERIQFFLRNRDDIKAWAAIESDVMAATRELLARAQPAIEERLLATEPDVIVGRGDGGQWERIMARRTPWPASVGLTLEWSRSVDPLGNARPKLGVFWWADPPTLVEPRGRFALSVDKPALQRLGFKVPLEGVWPVGMWVTSSPEWWRDPETWLAEIVDRFVQAWPLVAPHVDAVLPANWQVSGG